MRSQFGKLGGDEGKVTGPEPGDGASSVGGFGDVEGTPGDALPGRADEACCLDAEHAGTSTSVKTDEAGPNPSGGR